MKTRKMRCTHRGKRPGNGISPMKWYEVLGQKAVRDFSVDELIEL